MAPTARFRATLTWEYTIPLDQDALDTYGTLDPTEMAVIDAQAPIGDIIGWVDDADSEPSITIEVLT